MTKGKTVKPRSPGSTSWAEQVEQEEEVSKTEEVQSEIEAKSWSTIVEKFVPTERFDLRSE